MKVVYVRHGDSGRDWTDLSEVGRRQIDLLAGELKRMFPHEQTKVITSEKPRATQSAEIIATVFGTNHDVFDCLSVKEDAGLISFQQLDAAVTTIVEFAKFSELLVVVTHSEFMLSLPMLVVSEMYDKCCPVHVDDYIGHGEAVYYDCRKSSYVHICPDLSL